MSAHTPSPWKVKFRRDHSCYISMGNPCSEHKQFDLPFSDIYSSDVADGRLIAAAPEMLAALQSARDFIHTDRTHFADCCLESAESGTFTATDDAAVLADYDGLLAKIDAAIAKATGQEGGAS